MFGKLKSLYQSSKQKSPHSLDALKTYYNILFKNPIVTEQNSSLLVETLRSISEILIWGDQNDSSVFDFFLEKQMITFFLLYMRQKHSQHLCVQLLQTLNILFENIRHETSLYYLLSNNHINNVINHEFDFADEEIMAYYISFLKTLSLKLNTHTINFFFDDKTSSFPLYTEAIKFYDNPEAMVRIAVRTITLNVYKVKNDSMLSFIRDKTANSYFSKLIKYIRRSVIELDELLWLHDQSKGLNASRNSVVGKLSTYMEDYFDDLHYIEDIFLLGIPSLSSILADHLMKHLLVPLCVFVLRRNRFYKLIKAEDFLNPVFAMFLLTEGILVIKHNPMLQNLLQLILFGDESFGEIYSTSGLPDDLNSNEISKGSGTLLESDEKLESLNKTDDEKSTAPFNLEVVQFRNKRNRFFVTLIEYLDCSNGDQMCFHALSLLHAMLLSLCEDDELRLQEVFVKSDLVSSVINALVFVISSSCQRVSKIRPITTALAAHLLLQLLIPNPAHLTSRVKDSLLYAKNESAIILRDNFKKDDIFLDLFEDEYRHGQLKSLNVELILRDPCILLPPAVTPLSGIEFSKRLPSGSVESLRYAMRVYFIMRQVHFALINQIDPDLPLTNPKDLVKPFDNLDLTNTDIVGCTVLMKGKEERCFLVFDPAQFILVEPDVKKIGWGIVKFAAPIQNIEIVADKEDSRVLHITLQQPSVSGDVHSQVNARFLFEDQIRCMTARKSLAKRRDVAREAKFEKITQLLNSAIPAIQNSLFSPPPYFRNIRRSYHSEVFSKFASPSSNSKRDTSNV